MLCTPLAFHVSLKPAPLQANLTRMAPSFKIDFGSYIPSKETIKARCTTLKAWELPKQESALAPDYVWTNKASNYPVVHERAGS